MKPTMLLCGVLLSSVLLVSCTANRATTIVGDDGAYWLSGSVIDIDDSVPRDGGVLTLTIVDQSGRVASAYVRGPNRNYDPTPREMQLYRTALGIREGDGVRAQISGNWVAELIVTGK